MPLNVTFNAALTRPLDRIRAALGDAPGETDSPQTEADVLLDDAMINAVLTARGVNLAAATRTAGEWDALRELAEYLIARYSLLPDTMTASDGTKTTWKNRLTHWQGLVAQARNLSGYAVSQPTRGARVCRR